MNPNDDYGWRGLEWGIAGCIVVIMATLAFFAPDLRPAPALPVPVSATYLADSVVGREAFAAHVPINLVLAVRRVENPRADTLAVSPAGAVGLMQVMPAWDSTYLVECGRMPATNPDRNACVGVRVLAHYLEREGGDVPRALCRYNGAHRLPRACQAYKDAVLRELARL